MKQTSFKLAYTGSNHHPGAKITIILILNLGILANKITVMIVKENKYGDIEYIDDMVFNPTIENRYF